LERCRALGAMNKITNFMDRLSRLSAYVGETVLWVCMASMAMVVCAQVFARYVLHHSIPWSEELARFIMIWLGLVGASAVMRDDSHVAITLLQERLPPKLAAFLRLLGRLAVGVFLFMLIREGFSLALFFIHQKSPALRISMFIPYSSLFISGFLMAVHLVHLALVDINQLIAGNNTDRLL
jgi:TRAP-type C4-dicarboxylate transport system permease small subunit